MHHIIEGFAAFNFQHHKDIMAGIMGNDCLQGSQVLSLFVPSNLGCCCILGQDKQYLGQGGKDEAST